MKKVLVYFVTKKDEFAKTYLNVPESTLNQPKADALFDIGKLLFNTKKVPMINLVAYKIPKYN